MAKQEIAGERNWYAIHTYAGYEKGEKGEKIINCLDALMQITLRH